MSLNVGSKRILNLFKLLKTSQLKPCFFSNASTIYNTPLIDESDTQHNDKILSMLNSYSAEELSKFQNIGREKARRLISYREKCGEFKTVQELEHIAGFTSSIIKSINKKGLVERKKKSYTAILDAAEAKEIKSLTAIDIGSTEIAWCCLSKDCKLIDWRSMEFRRLKPYNPKELIESVKSVLEAMPITDIMVVELQNHKSLSKDNSVFPYILHNRLTEAVIHSISKSYTVSLDPNVVRRHFNLQKGINKQYYSMTVVTDLLSETRHRARNLQDEETDISYDHGIPGGSELVQSIICANGTAFNSVLAGHEKLEAFSIQQQFIDYFNGKKNKECLSDSLLQALAFLELEIYR